MEAVREKMSRSGRGVASRDWVRNSMQFFGLLLALSISLQTQAQINGEHIRSIVRISTNIGDFSIGLYDEATPKTVANFLGYVERGDYNQTYIHRTANTTGGEFQIVQGGGFRLPPQWKMNRGFPMCAAPLPWLRWLVTRTALPASGS